MDVCNLRLYGLSLGYMAQYRWGYDTRGERAKSPHRELVAIGPKPFCPVPFPLPPSKREQQVRIIWREAWNVKRLPLRVASLTDLPLIPSANRVIICHNGPRGFALPHGSSSLVAMERAGRAGEATVRECCHGNMQSGLGAKPK